MTRPLVSHNPLGEKWEAPDNSMLSENPGVALVSTEHLFLSLSDVV